ncbi:MAG TPA: [LysW]-aminoadipate kinase [Candidatus Acidoferrales bacterium]|nr:[LysW]-aminoadipate kinase [Candidatus Acidoferrales bacterium]
MIIIKIGGGQTIDLDNIIIDLKELKEPYIIVHGGNYVFDNLIKELGIKKKLLTSVDGQTSRYTDQEMIDTMLMSYAGYMNKTIVTKCQQSGINAVGLTGLDGKLVRGKKHKAILTVEHGKKKVIRDDMTGTVEEINVNLLKTLIKNSYVPVITPPVLSFENEIINVDGDKIALYIARELKADTLLFLIEAEGMLKDVNDSKSVIPIIKKTEIEEYLMYAKGRMKKKLLVSKWALENKIERIIISDGRTNQPITNALHNKKGTLIQ